MTAKPRIYLHMSRWWRCISKLDDYSYLVGDGATPQEAYDDWALWKPKHD